MTSSLEGEGGVGQKMTCDDMMTKCPLFAEILGKPIISKNISSPKSWAISNLNLERAAELKR